MTKKQKITYVKRALATGLRGDKCHECISVRGTRVRGYEGTRVREYEGTRVRGYEGARVRGCEGTRVRDY